MQTGTYRPDPRGRKSRPTMLSSTEDFPELCTQKIRGKNESRAQKEGQKVQIRLEKPLERQFRARKREEKRIDLPPDDGHGRKSLPERGKGVSLAATMVPKDGAGALNPIHQTDQALHARRLRSSPAWWTPIPSSSARDLGGRRTEDSSSTKSGSGGGRWRPPERGRRSSRRRNWSRVVKQPLPEASLQRLPHFWWAVIFNNRKSILFTRKPFFRKQNY